MGRVYFDYGGGSPVDPRVIEVMLPYMKENFGNPSSLHSDGLAAKNAILEAKEKLASLINAQAKEIVFTSGGTESNNFALKGIARRNKDKGKHIITTSIEHISILNTCKQLQKEGFEISFVPVDEYGTVDTDKLRDEIRDDTILISVMYANGEVGTIEPIKEIGEIASEKGIYLHTDAVAAVGKIPIDVSENIDLMSISSNDIYGPKGTGCLYIKNKTKIQPMLQGGGQEGGLRSGSEDVASILGMARAAEIAKEEMKSEGERTAALRDRLIKGILSEIGDTYLNGHPTDRLPNNVNVRFSYIEGESIILSLDMEGISASSSSACTSKTLEPSHVLTAMGISHADSQGALLMTLGRYSEVKDVDKMLDTLPEIIKRLRDMSPLTPR
ncbi:MAG: aminotransferase class V-fold PLP-dependent enzyme [Halobacteriota archaeon]|nr:aminotransferase class V-fold PLP-dependent enzyme [Halobacteriota archaeon]